MFEPVQANVTSTSRQSTGFVVNRKVRPDVRGLQSPTKVRIQKGAWLLNQGSRLRVSSREKKEPQMLTFCASHRVLSTVKFITIGIRLEA